MDDFSSHQRGRSLISLRRSEIDENKIQGFILGVSNQLVLLQYVYDFNLDGLMVLRTGDITELQCSKTDEFQRRLLADEGLLQRVPFDFSADLSSWRSAIGDLSRAFPYVILECERLEEPDFAIGRIVETAPAEVRIECFTGAANWLEKPVRFKYEDITSCQVDTNYINAYGRYFERRAP